MIQPQVYIYPLPVESPSHLPPHLPPSRLIQSPCIFRTFHLNAEEYTFFSSAHETFSRIDHILGHKSNLSKFKKSEIISSIFSNHNAMKLGINYRGKKTVKNTNTWRLNNTFLNNQQVTEEIKRKIKKFLETNDNENISSFIFCLPHLPYSKKNTLSFLHKYFIIFSSQF